MTFRLNAGRAALLIGTALPLTLLADAARADCQQAGSVVTCTGTDATGFGNGTQNNMTVTVVPGAAVAVGNNIVALNLGDDNTVTNRGTIVAGFDGIGIYVQANSTAWNTGVITVGDSGFGIGGNSNSTLVNDGLIQTGSNGFGLRGGAAFSGNTLVNNGVIAGGNASYGLWAADDATLINNGKITIGSGFGMGMRASSGTIVNNGTVVAGAGAFSVGTTAANNTVINNGVLDGRLRLLGFESSFTNHGLLTITDPGTAVGAQHVVDAGGLSFTQSATGILALRVNAAGARDQVFMFGQANLAGTVRAVLQPGLYADQTTYSQAFVTSLPINGGFDQAFAYGQGGSAPLAFFTVSAVTAANVVNLVVTRTPFGQASGLTANQRAVGTALESQYSTTLTGQQAAFYGNLLQATSTGVLGSLSGEGLAASHQTAFYVGGLFNTALTDQVALWRNGGRNGVVAGGIPLGYAAERKPGDAFAAIYKAPPPAAYQPSWNAWVSGFAGRQNLDANAGVGSAAADARTTGGALGVDYAFSNVLLGVGVGLSTSSFGVPDRSTTGDTDGRHIGAYGAVRFGGSYASALVSYGEFDNRTRRTIAGVGLTETAVAGFTGEQVGARFEIGHRFVFDRFGVTPFAAIQWSELRQQGFTESSTTAAGGLGVLGLSVAGRTVESLPFFLGAQVDTTVALTNTMWLSPFVRAAWVHESKPDRQLSASFVSIPGASFTVDGARPSTDALKLDAGARLALTPYAALIASFNGEFGDASTAYAGSAALRVSW